jgi:bacterioferritin (cytochrome b1)
VSLWDQIREALGAVWADVQGPREAERTQLITWLTEAGRAEQRLSAQIRQMIPAIPYEQFHRRLAAMARDDEQHASLIQECLRTLGGLVSNSLKASEESANNLPSGPWRRLQGVLNAKRELYERYRQQASAVDDPGLQSLLERLRDDEARHQDHLVEMLIQLDAHVHETIT